MTELTLKTAIVASALTDSVREAPRLARLHGFDGLLFDAYAPALNLPDLSGSGRREFRHMLGAENRQLVGLRVDLDSARGLGPGADVDRAIAQLDRAMEVAAALGAPLLCVDLGPLPAPPREARPKPKIRPEDAGLIIIPTSAAPAVNPTPVDDIPTKIDPGFIAQFDGALVEIGRRADRYSVTVALHSELSSLAAIDRAMQAARCPWFGLDLDPVAILRDEWDADEVFSHLGIFIRHVRARDALRGTDRRTKPAIPGQGSTDWRHLLANLDQSGYRGWLTLDPMDLPNRATATSAGLAHLAESLARR